MQVMPAQASERQELVLGIEGLFAFLKIQICIGHLQAAPHFSRCTSGLSFNFVQRIDASTSDL